MSRSPEMDTCAACRFESGYRQVRAPRSAQLNSRRSCTHAAPRRASDEDTILRPCLPLYQASHLLSCVLTHVPTHLFAAATDPDTAYRIITDPDNARMFRNIEGERRVCSMIHADTAVGTTLHGNCVGLYNAMVLVDKAS